MRTLRYLFLCATLALSACSRTGSADRNTRSAANSFLDKESNFFLMRYGKPFAVNEGVERVLEWTINDLTVRATFKDSKAIRIEYILPIWTTTQVQEQLGDIGSNWTPVPGEIKRWVSAERFYAQLVDHALTFQIDPF